MICAPAALLAAAVVGGCLARAQGFEAWNASFRAELSDRTGTVASIRVLDHASPGDELTSDSLRLRNVDASTVEVAWLGGSCVTGASFSLSPERGDAFGLRYDIGPPCPEADAAGYGLEIRFLQPVDAGAIELVPDWGP